MTPRREHIALLSTALLFAAIHACTVDDSELTFQGSGGDAGASAGGSAGEPEGAPAGAGEGGRAGDAGSGNGAGAGGQAGDGGPAGAGGQAGERGQGADGGAAGDAGRAGAGGQGGEGGSGAECGDGILDDGEACDDGAGNSDTEPDACRSGCVEPSCGDGVVDSNEECEPASNAECSTECELLLALGDDCLDDAECASDHCADFVCCEQACDGVCEECNASGACVMPADDAACPDVTCPADSGCRNYTSASITSNLCAALGQCKDAEACPFTPSPEGTDCETDRKCDDQGNCLQRVVPCGQSSCPVKPGVCCWYFMLGVASCESGDVCPDIDSNAGREITCNSLEQCRSDEVCCSRSDPGGNEVVCRVSCDPANIAVAHSPICNFDNPALAPCPGTTVCESAVPNDVPPDNGYFKCSGPYP